MSIIEKAAGKIGTGSPRTAPQSANVASAQDAGLIEHALNKQRNSQATPFVATHVEPIFSEPDAEVLEGNSRVQTINLARLHRMGVVSPDAEKSQIAEEFRIIKRPLIANAFGQGTARVKNGNLIMITSALPGEGQELLRHQPRHFNGDGNGSHRAAD